MTCGSEIYTTASINRDELIEVKQQIFADLIRYICLIQIKHNDSEYLEEAISYIYSYFLLFLSDLQREHTLYDNIMDYLSSLEYITDLEDTEIIADLSSIFDEIEASIEQREIYYVSFLQHLDEVLSNDYLTRNYLFANYISPLSEDKCNDLKELIPKI